ncbi:MAG: DUF3536 domain-containing protein [Gemmatimonadota bacterium]
MFSATSSHRYGRPSQPAGAADARQESQRTSGEIRNRRSARLINNGHVASVNRSLVIHAHFYQPPREDPFLNEVESELSAAPCHDWNQRIERECYRAVVAARIPAPSGRIAKVVNTLESISFNVGPTLFEWLERHAADTYREMIAADRSSCDRLDGHGNAIAHPYHHVILPLASRRDKTTEVRWGITDFRRRFGRDPEGMWLPETGVDDETLDVIAAEGIRFTILAPHQVVTPPPHGLPGRYRTGGGREIAVCIYDGPMSHGIAFGGLVRDADAWWKEIADWRQRRRAGDDRAAAVRVKRRTPATPAESLLNTTELISAATDGETYGHHHKFAEMALAAVVERARTAGLVIENFASFIARHPPAHDVALVEPTSWSCAHGVERWRSNCGCRLDGTLNPSQEWRAHLRTGLDVLGERIHQTFEVEGSAHFRDPWEVRDAYGDVVATEDQAGRASFLDRWLVPGVSDRARAFELLEMERDALRMFTSCAWFFDDIGGLEARQILKYARRTIDLSRAEDASADFATALERALSNDPRVGNGRLVFESIEGATSAAVRTVAGIAALNELGIVEDHTPAQFSIVVGTAETELVDRRTGRRQRFGARVAARSPGDICVEVEAAPDGRALLRRVCVPEFPERVRRRVRRALRDSLLPLCLTKEELSKLSSGEATLRGLVALALRRAVAQASDPASIGVASAMVDLFVQLETSIPFDVQTEYWRVWSAADGEGRVMLSPLGHKLGFEAAAR